MANEYKTLLTNAGAAKIAAAVASGIPLCVKTAAVGDGNGADYSPTPDQTALRREVWSGPISFSEIDPAEPKIIHVRFVVPLEVGGFTVREAGLFDGVGTLLAVCNLPATKKEIYTTGATGNLIINMHIVVTHTDALELIIRPDLDTVTQEQMQEAVTSHDCSPTAHGDLQAGITLLEQNQQRHFGDALIHVTAADKLNWNAKETPDGAQDKVDVHANNKDNPHGVTIAQIGAEASGSAAAVQLNLNNHAKDYTLHSGTAKATGNATALLASIPTLSLVDGVVIRIKLHVAIQAGATLNVNSSGAMAIVDVKGRPVKEGAIANAYLTLVYNGTNFILQGEGGGVRVSGNYGSTYTATSDRYKHNTSFEINYFVGGTIPKRGDY